MTDTKQPEALRLADRLDANASGGNVTTVDEERAIAQTLRRLHAENTTLQQGYEAARLEIEARNKHLVKESARTAEEKLRADRMTEQHRMQCQMREGLEREIEALRRRECLHQIAEPAHPAGEYPPLPKPALPRGGFPDLFDADLMRAYVDADRTMRAQAAPTAVAGPSEAVNIERRAFIRGWDERGMAHQLKGTEESDRRMKELADIYFPRAAPTTQAAPQQEAREPVDSMGTPLSCGKPLCSPGNHNPLCKRAAPQPAPVAQGDAWRDLLWQIADALECTPCTADEVLPKVLTIAEEAARYRWLRDPASNVALVLDKRTGYVPADERLPGVGGYHTYEYRAGEELDAAIDAARSQAKAKEGGAA